MGRDRWHSNRSGQKFKSEFQPGGRYQEGKYSTFGNIEEFKDELRQHLPEHLPMGLQSPPPLPGGFDIEGYRSSFGFEPKWDLSNIGAAQAPGDAPVSPALEDIYQELRIADKLDPKELSLGAPVLPEQVALIDERIILIGAAGAGKTTWIRHTFFQLLQRPDICPFLIELRKVAKTLNSLKAAGKARSLVSYLQAMIEEMDCRAEGIEDALASQGGPRPILLVDGWDELGGLGQEFRQKLVSFLRTHPRVGVVATSRPYGQEKPDAQDGFQRRYIQPFNDEEIQAFSTRFWAICYGRDPKHAELAERFQLALRSPSATTDLARNPLLCTMMLFISRSQTLPDERHDLYHACIGHMLSAYRREEAEVPGMPCHWRPEKMNERLRAAAALAFATHSRKEYYDGRVIVLPLSEMASLLPQTCEGHRQEFLAWMVGPAGILTDYSDGSLSFVHLSFQEYLAAWHIANVLPEDQQAFDVWSRNDKWNEVLRLCAGIIWAGRRERFAAVAESLLETDDGLCTLGGMLADGWGTPELFKRWIKRFLPMLKTWYPSGAGLCGRAWATCRQTSRRSELQAAWDAGVPLWSWLARGRAEAWSRIANLTLPSALGQGAVIFEARNNIVSNESHCALGRVWTFAVPAWPEEPWEIALCQVWPSARRVLGMRVQTFISLLGKNAWTKQAAQVTGSVGKFKISEREEELLRHLNKFFAHTTTFWPIRQTLTDIARDTVRYQAHFGPFIDPNDASFRSITVFNDEGEMTFMARFGYWYLSGHSKPGPLRLSSSRRMADHFSSFVTQQKPEAKHIDRIILKFGLDPKSSKAKDLALVESVANSRGAARSFLASLPPTQNPTIALISIACRESLHPGKYWKELDSALKTHAGDPIWPALARHLSRRSTTADRELRIDLAQHPEKRDPPLQWGLKYVVRGDVMMPDGSVRMLDEFFTRHGLPSPTYLDEVRDEVGPTCVEKNRRKRNPAAPSRRHT